MLSHYIKIALRNVLKYKAQSAISITGLAVSFVFITLAVLWVRYEVTYDTAGYADNVYAVLKQSEHNANNYGTRFNVTVPENILRPYPEVAAATNIAS